MEATPPPPQPLPPPPTHFGCNCSGKKCAVFVCWIKLHSTNTWNNTQRGKTVELAQTVGIFFCGWCSSSFGRCCFSPLLFAWYFLLSPPLGGLFFPLSSVGWCLPVALSSWGLGWPSPSFSACAESEKEQCRPQHEDQLDPRKGEATSTQEGRPSGFLLSFFFRSSFSFPLVVGSGIK